MSLVALAHWPYGYYLVLRVVILAGALFVAALIYQRTKQFTIWIGLFLIASVAFNPFAPLHLTRGAWSILNIGTAALFIGHYFIVRSQSVPTTT